MYSHLPVRLNDSISSDRFANTVTNTVNILTRLGSQLDLELEGVKATRKLHPQLKGQWLRHLQDHRLLAANLIVSKDWLPSTAFMHEELLAQTIFQAAKNQKQGLSQTTLKVLQTKKSRMSVQIWTARHLELQDVE